MTSKSGGAAHSMSIDGGGDGGAEGYGVAQGQVVRRRGQRAAGQKREDFTAVYQTN